MTPIGTRFVALWDYWRREGTEEFDFLTVKVALEKTFEPTLDHDKAIPASWKAENPEMVAKMEEIFRPVLRRGKRKWLSNSKMKRIVILKLERCLGRLLIRERAGLTWLNGLWTTCQTLIFRNDNPFPSDGIDLEKAFLGPTHALLPPQESLSTSDVDQVITAVYQQWGEHGEIPFDVLDTSKAVIMKTWRVNPTFYDPFWYNSRLTDNVHEFNPVDEFCKAFYGDSMAYMTEKPEPSGFLDERTLISFTSLFFWNVALSMGYLLYNGCLQLEIRVNPVNSLAHSIREEAEERNTKGWPAKYHRILSSNIPDYTGMLSFFVDVMPALHKTTSKIDTHMESNILFNTGLWKDYEHFLCSSTAIPSLADIEAIMGFRLLSESDA